MIEAWHFVDDTLRDGRPIPADGEWLVHAGPVKICAAGLHASRRPWHALEYAPGSVLCRVECDEIVTEQADKLVCRRRRIIERIDITETLRYFARMQALSVIHLYDNPPDVVLDYLMTGDASTRAAARAAARDATRTAARTAARAAAWAAALATARDATRATARAAAWATAWATTRAAAWAAARDAAWATARPAARAAAWATARAAARAAAWTAAGSDFDALVQEQFGMAA